MDIHDRRTKDERKDPRYIQTDRKTLVIDDQSPLCLYTSPGPYQSVQSTISHQSLGLHILFFFFLLPFFFRLFPHTCETEFTTSADEKEFGGPVDSFLI